MLTDYLIGGHMVSSVGSAPYSYLDQLTGKKAAPAVLNTVASVKKDTATANTAKELGLSPEVLALLKNLGGDNKTTSLLGNNISSTADNPFASLFGYSTANSPRNILANIQSDLFGINSSSGIYQAALNGAANKRSATATGVDHMSKVLAAYSAGFNYKPGKTLDITG